MTRKRADIVLVGGGSGGHLTPLIPIAQQLHKKAPELRIAHIGQKNDPLNSIAYSSDISQHYEVSAGKLRRYHGDSLLKRLFNVKDNLLNFRDAFRVVAGTYQSWVLLGKLKPKALMAKGGYVGVPVGFAAKLRRVPYITHDSDAQVSLANKLIAGAAKYHTTAQSPDNYTGYDQSKVVRVGVPVRAQFARVTDEEQQKSKRKLGYKKSDNSLLVLGGGLGARKINEALVSIAPALLGGDRGLRINHITGHKLLKETKEMYESKVDKSLMGRVNTIAFSDSLSVLSAAADVVITRAGATNMAEFSAQGKACIVVPNPLLTGGHQSKNAKVYQDNNAVILVKEEELEEALLPSVQSLFQDETRQKQLSDSLHSLFSPDAAEKISDILLEISGI